MIEEAAIQFLDSSWRNNCFLSAFRTYDLRLHPHLLQMLFTVGMMTRQILGILKQLIAHWTTEIFSSHLYIFSNHHQMCIWSLNYRIPHVCSEHHKPCNKTCSHGIIPLTELRQSQVRCHRSTKPKGHDLQRTWHRAVVVLLWDMRSTGVSLLYSEGSQWPQSWYCEGNGWLD